MDAMVNVTELTVSYLLFTTAGLSDMLLTTDAQISIWGMSFRISWLSNECCCVLRHSRDTTCNEAWTIDGQALAGKNFSLLSTAAHTAFFVVFFCFVFHAAAQHRCWHAPAAVTKDLTSRTETPNRAISFDSNRDYLNAVLD